MLLILAFVCLAGALLIAAQTLASPRREQRASLRRADGGTPRAGGIRRLRPLRGMRAAIEPALARLASRIDPRATEERVALRLLSAGLVHTVSPTGFLASKVVLGASGVATGALLGPLLEARAAITLALAGALGLLGFLLPDQVIAARARRRREQMRRELPGALDVLAVSVEAGLGFDGALAKLSEHMRGPLVDELSLLLAELRIGESRSNALRKLAARLDIPELTTLVSALVQAEQLGTPLGRMLRVQARESRQRRQVAAEERALKAPVKMLLPTAAFIFPAMFIVIIAPALITIAGSL